MAIEMNATAVYTSVLPVSRLSRRVRRARLPGPAAHCRLAHQAKLLTAEVAAERSGKSRSPRSRPSVWNSGANSQLQTFAAACPERSSVHRDRDDSAHPERLTALPSSSRRTAPWQSRRTKPSSSRRDLNGNLTLEKAGTVVDSYTWDPENRLSVWNSGAYSQLQTFSYDPSGLRVRRTLPTRTDNLLNDDQNVAQVVTGDPVVYQHLPGIWGAVFSNRFSGASRFYVPDFQGHTRLYLDSTQAIVGTALYDAWGAEILNPGGIKLDFSAYGAWGYFRDSPTASYVRKRRLRRDWGRWLSVDPIGLWSGDTDLYRYVRNVPTRQVDPSGLITVIPILRDRWIIGSMPQCCGGLRLVWDFRLSKTYGYTGYLVQKVTVKLGDVRRCSDQTALFPPKCHDFTYYEAWPVQKDQHYADAHYEWQYTDLASWNNFNLIEAGTRTRGAASQTGEIRFFSLSTIVAIDTWTIEANPDWTPDYSRGECEEYGHAGQLHATDKTPIWWAQGKHVQTEPIAKREARANWCCCDDTSHSFHGESNGAPRFEGNLGLCTDLGTW